LRWRVAVARGDVDAVVYFFTTLSKLQASGLVRIMFSFQNKPPQPGVEDATAASHPDLGKIFEWRPIVGPPGLSGDKSLLLSDNLISPAQSPEAIFWSAKVGTALYPLDHKVTADMFEQQKALVQKYRGTS
jgi:hypothetical protein